MGEIDGKKPKCLLEVGGRTILQRALATLGAAGVEEALLVVGYEKEQILARLLEASDSSALSVAPGQFDDEAMKVELGPGGYLAASSKAVPAEKCAGEWIGLARFVGGDSSPLFDSIEELLLQGRYQDYDTAAFSCLARRGIKITIVGTDGLPYVEVDTPEDLARARALFPAFPAD